MPPEVFLAEVPLGNEPLPIVLPFDNVSADDGVLLVTVGLGNELPLAEVLLTGNAPPDDVIPPTWCLTRI